MSADRCKHFAMAVPFDPAMSPRYHDGECVICERDALPELGDEVLTVLHDGRRMVRRLAAIDAQSVTLQPVNGDSMAVRLADVLGLFLVVGCTPRRARPAGGAHAACLEVGQ